MKYYVDKVFCIFKDEGKSGKELLWFLVENENASEPDIAYHKNKQSLGEKARLCADSLIKVSEDQQENSLAMNPDHHKQIPPLFTTKEPSAVIMYCLNIAVTKGILKRIHNVDKTVEIIAHLIRNSKGEKFKDSTLKARYTSQDHTTIKRFDNLAILFNDEQNYRKILFNKKHNASGVAQKSNLRFIAANRD